MFQSSMRVSNNNISPSAPSERDQEDDTDIQRVAADLAFVLQHLAGRAYQHKLLELEHLITVAAFAARDIVAPSKQ